MAPVLTNGDYRFKSASPSVSNNYLGIRSAGQVFGVAQDAYSDEQKWRVTKRSDGYYDIHNVGTDSLLRVNPPSKGDIAYTLNVQGTKDVPWDLENFNGYIIFKCTGKYAPNVIDLNTRDRAVLWDSSKQPNQLWIAENLSGGSAPTPGPLPNTNTNTNTPDRPAAKANPQWVPVQGANIPPNAIQGGWEADGTPIYVARAWFSNLNAYRQGKAGRHLRGYCLIPQDHKENVFNNYEVLVGEPGSYQWVLYPPGNLDPSKLWTENRKLAKPIDAGRDPQWGDRYVVQTIHKNAVICGKASRQNVWIPADGTEQHVHGNSLVLCYAD